MKAAPPMISAMVTNANSAKSRLKKRRLRVLELTGFLRFRMPGCVANAFSPHSLKRFAAAAQRLPKLPVAEAGGGGQRLDS